jgi:mannose-6-phosphate isomerase-like protein (cupin superfamily)
MDKQALVGRRGEGERLAVGGGAVTLQVTSEHSDGGLTLIEYEVPAGFPGPPLHVHAFDELFYVLDGELAFRLGDDAVTLGAGGHVYAPGNHPHTFSNPSGEPARMLVVTSPGGFEGFFRAVAAATVEGQIPDPATMARLNAEYGVTLA